MKKGRFLSFLLLFAIILSFIPKVRANDPVNIYLFHDPVCLHCQAEEEFLKSIEDEYNINVTKINVYDNEDLFSDVKAVFKEEDALTPYTVIGGVSLRGFNDQTKQDIINLIERYLEEDEVDVVQKVINNQEVLLSDLDTLVRETVVLPFIGEVELEDLSLGLAAVLIGTVDGFNPCAMWVLVLLITLLINSKDKKRMWYLGLIFLLTTALVYFLILMSWLQVAIALTTINWFRFIIGALAVGFGSYNVYKYIKSLKSDEGCEVVNEGRRHRIVERVKKIIREERIIIAIIGIILLALVVNLIEFACSAGLPFLYAQILAYNNLEFSVYLMYILIYVFFFLLDDILIFSIAMITLKVTGVSNKYTKYSSLIGGIIMFIIGFLLVFFPNIIMFN
ncbi:MAG: hypothetical protein PHF05_06550 [Candidatus Izemoplasmatales bacterium]|nr:hypothetical protein [Candidatus Izemoplasmatales bacterium]MDD4070094.1 hypothetical protein [Candidatus Izemoplasmatales bacterium]